MTLDEAKALQKGDRVYSMESKDADGSASKWRVTGEVQTWKRDESRVRVPLKRGLYEYCALTEEELHLFSLTSPVVMAV